MQILYPLLNVISPLLLSKSAGPKQIIISGFHCVYTLYMSLGGKGLTRRTSLQFTHSRTV
jgi:hypothetical protein